MNGLLAHLTQYVCPTCGADFSNHLNGAAALEMHKVGHAQRNEGIQVRTCPMCQGHGKVSTDTTLRGQQ